MDAELHGQNRFNYYLVSQHGQPYKEVESRNYPRGLERERIVKVIGNLIPTLIKEAGLLPRRELDIQEKQQHSSRPAEQLNLGF